jgi:hypothetical protein
VTCQNVAKQPVRLGWNLANLPDLAGFFKRKTLLNGWLVCLIISSEQAVSLATAVSHQTPATARPHQAAAQG